MLEAARPVAQEKYAGLEDAEGVLAYDLGTELVVEFEQQSVFVFGFELVGHSLVGDEIVLGLVLQRFVQLVELPHLAHIADIPLQHFLFLPHLGQGVAHLVQQIAKADHPHNLNQYHHCHFACVLGGDVSVADGEDGGAGEIEGVDVAVEDAGGLGGDGVDPGVLGVELAG